MIVRIKHLLLFIIGATLGLVLAFWTYSTVFENTFKILLADIDKDWANVEMSMSKIVDQAIKLEKMLVTDKIKHDSSLFEKFIEIRGKALGADSYDVRVPLLDEMETKTSEMVAFYNPRYDLRNRRFSYIEWGLTAQELIKKYEEEVKKYNYTVIDFNKKVKAFPFSLKAEEMKLKLIPVAKENEIDAVQVATEE